MSATPWEWRSSSSGGDPSSPPKAFFSRDAATVAKDLLGCILLSRIDEVEVEGVIVEAEAYVGPHDPASHSAERIGKTERNASMFGPPGHAYVYRSYGIHWCLNVVTNDPGYPAAVLVRALDPVRGLDRMLDRRRGVKPLCAGPGRLAQALGVSSELDGHPLWKDPLRILNGWSIPEGRVGISGRIGVREASNWPLRFFLKGHPEVSRKSW